MTSPQVMYQLTTFLKQIDFFTGSRTKSKLRCWIEDGRTVKQLILEILRDTEITDFSKEGETVTWKYGF